MKLMLIPIIVLALLAVAFVTLAKQRNATTANYRRKSPILNGAEQKLFQQLKSALPDHHVMTQVRLADIIENTTGGRQGLNQIISKSVDFVICDHTFNVLACIELDGKTHQRQDRQKADRTKDDALESAGIKILRWKPATLPKAEELRQLILQDQ